MTAGQKQPLSRDSTADWYASEPGIGATLIAEMKLHRRRMKGQWMRVFGLAVLVTAGLVAALANRPRLYTASIVLRVTESSLNQGDISEFRSRDLRNHVYNYILSKRVIRDEIIIKRGVALDTFHNLGEEDAIAEIKDALSIDVVNNYFLFDERYESTPRSLRLIIRYTATNPGVAYQMASVFAGLVVDNVQSQRLVDAQYVRRSADMSMTWASSRIDAQRQRRHALMLELARAEDTGDEPAAAAARIALRDLEKALRAGERELTVQDGTAHAMELGARLEETAMALQWEVIGEERPDPTPGLGVLHLVAIGCLVFFLGVPLCTVGLSVFDSRVYDRDDIACMGMGVIAHIPSLPGVPNTRHIRQSRR